MGATLAVQKPHWYKFHVSRCPVCDASEIERERIYGEKPEDWTDRYEYHPLYCLCFL